MNSGKENCEICDAAFSRALEAREMMFGFRDSFTYCQCANCCALQIKRIPKDIGRFYPADYYSYQPLASSVARRRRRGARRRRILEWPRIAMPLLRLLSKADDTFYIYRAMGMRPASRVLDVGGGSGAHVLEMRDAGISGTLGIDPFIPDDVVFEDKLLARKIAIDDLSGEYDFITFHHSLEHMPRQIDTLTQARRLLAPGGQVLIRIPTVTSEAFETYQENWVNLDAPRHFILHSHKSLGIAAAKAGLRVNRLWCDSTGMQFMGSEQYRKDIPLTDPRSAAKTKSSELFSRAQRKNYEWRAMVLNRILRGDLLCAILVAA